MSPEAADRLRAYQQVLDALRAIGPPPEADLALVGILREICNQAGQWMREVTTAYYAQLPDPTLHDCWVDDEPCEVAEAIEPALPEQVETSDARGYLKERTPCGWCRGAENAAAKLKGVRLGRLERELLLKAAPALDYSPSPWQRSGGEPILPADCSAAKRSAILRARMKLWRAGLVWDGSEERKVQVHRRATEWESYGRMVQQPATDYEATGQIPTIRLSPFGAEIVARYRAELTSGKAIRWDGRVQEALAATRKSVHELLVILNRTASHCFPLHQIDKDMAAVLQKLVTTEAP
jgi:hypothetical protein